MNRSGSKLTLFFLLLMSLILLAACQASPKTEVSMQTSQNECVKIADRIERERCLDAAYRQ